MGTILLCCSGIVAFWGLGLFGFELVVLLTAIATASHVPLVAFFTFKAQQSIAPEDSTADPEEYNNALFEMLDRINKRIAVTEASKHLHKCTENTEETGIQETPIKVFHPASEIPKTEDESNPDHSKLTEGATEPSKEPLPLSATMLRKKRMFTFEEMLSEDLEIEKRRHRRRALNSVGSFNSLPN